MAKIIIVLPNKEHHQLDVPDTVVVAQVNDIIVYNNIKARVIDRQFSYHPQGVEIKLFVQLFPELQV